MAVAVKNITLWRKEIENKTGMLAQTLEPFAKLGTDLQVVMGYRIPGEESKAALELYPVTGRKPAAPNIHPRVRVSFCCIAARWEGWPAPSSARA